VTKTFTKFYQHDEDIKKQSIDTGTLWTIGEGRSLLFEGVDGEGVNKSAVEVRAVLVTDKNVFFATDPEMLSNCMSEGHHGSLASSAAYEAVAKWWKTSGNNDERDLGFIQSSLWLEPAYKSVQNHSHSDDWMSSVLRLLLTGSTQDSNDFPVETLPAFAKIAPSLPVLGSSREKNAMGWEIRMSSLRPTSTKP
jgi:hypothetical protein